MRLKKVGPIALAGLLIFSACGATDDAEIYHNIHEQTEGIQVGLVMSPSGPGDRSLNDAAFSGALQAQVEHGVKISMLQPQNNSDFFAHLGEFSEDGRYDLVIMVGGAEAQTDALARASERWKNQKFAQVDAAIDKPNVSGVQTKWHENMFLTGVVAGLGTQSDMPLAKPDHNKIAIIIGEHITFMDEAIIGFEAGARLVNPDVEVIAQFIGSFSDQALAHQMAMELYDSGVDFIQVIGGGAGIGVYMAAREADAYAFGAGANVNFMAPDNIVATAYRNVASIIFDEIGDFVNGDFQGGLRIKGLDSGLIGYDDFQSAVALPDTIARKKDTIEAMVRDGSLTVPSTRDELETWLQEVELRELLKSID